MSGSRALVTSKFNTPANKTQSEFLDRNHVSSTFRGPVYAVEDIYVPCALCQAPVDPVTRVPVGRLYFHPRCLRCSVCERPSNNGAFVERRGQPVCAECAHRGFQPAKKLATSAYASQDAWGQNALLSQMHASRTPASAFTDGQLRLQARQQALLVHDSNIRLLGSAYGDDPSQRVAYINDPTNVAARLQSRQQSRQGGQRGATLPDGTPARQLLPSLSAAAGSASLRSNMASRGGKR